MNRSSSFPVFGFLACALILAEGLALLTAARVGMLGAQPSRPPPANVPLMLHAAYRGGAREYHVTPWGSPNNAGTVEAPLDLATALSKDSPARPGDTIWLHGGRYSGTYISQLSGAPGAPITVRQYPNERATIDSSPSPKEALLALGQWTWFWGFEVMNSDANRYSSKPGPWPDDLRRGGGVTARGAQLKFINMVVHDTTGGFGIWDDSIGTEAYGNLIYHNGWQAPDRGHGHGIYTQNAGDTPRAIRENVIFNQFSHGIHAYGSERAYLDNIVLEGNISFNNGSIAGDYARDILLGGGRVAHNPVLRGNLTYGGAQTNVGFSAGCANGKVVDNYFVGSALTIVNCTTVMQRNTIYSTSQHEAALRDQYPRNNYYRKPPSGVVVRMRPNRYEPGRAHIAVYNWARSDRVRVNASAVCGPANEHYEIRDAQDFFGSPVAVGRCGDGWIEIDMSPRTVTPPVGEVPAAPKHTAPEFGVYVMLRAAPPQALSDARNSPGEPSLHRR